MQMHLIKKRGGGGDVEALLHLSVEVASTITPAITLIFIATQIFLKSCSSMSFLSFLFCQ
jgi:hypothetical protein